MATRPVGKPVTSSNADRVRVHPDLYSMPDGVWNVQDALTRVVNGGDITDVASGTYNVLPTDSHIVCYGEATVVLPLSSERHGFIKITNAGTGEVTVETTAPEQISGEPSKILAFQWTTIDASPVDGGYVI